MFLHLALLLEKQVPRGGERNVERDRDVQNCTMKKTVPNTTAEEQMLWLIHRSVKRNGYDLSH